MFIRSWSKLEQLIQNIDPNLTTTYKYGYYSTHTVCLPTFFPDRETDAAWAYSLFTIWINFLGFVFIAVGYSLMFRWDRLDDKISVSSRLDIHGIRRLPSFLSSFFREAAKQSKAITENLEAKKSRDKQNLLLQRKLARICASDFFCWIPVSIMAFLQLSGCRFSNDRLFSY